ncbi:hypothetical protein ABPG74_007958 [Tetrahymena malaccensis]
MEQSDNSQDSSFSLKTLPLYSQLPLACFMRGLLYPLELLNLRRQANQTSFRLGLEDKVNNYFQMFRIVKKDGILGFYKGFCPYLIHNMINTSLLYFFTANPYEKKTQYLIQSLILPISYPFLLVSNLIALNTNQKMITIFKNYYRQFTISGFYIGFSLFMASNLINTLPRMICSEQDSSYIFSTTFIFSYPIDTLRARLLAKPNQHLRLKYIIYVAKNIMYKQESIKSFYVGSLPATIFFFTSLVLHKCMDSQKYKKLIEQEMIAEQMEKSNETNQNN